MKTATKTFLRKVRQDKMWDTIRKRIKELLLIVPPKKTSKSISSKNTSELLVTRISQYFQNSKTAHLVIIGVTEFQKLAIENLFRSMGVPGDRIVYHLDYHFFKKKSVNTLYDPQSDNLFIIGPTPENSPEGDLWDDMYRLFGDGRVVKAELPSGELKINKDSLQQAIMKLF